MKVINLGEKNTVLNNFIAQMRDKTVQKEKMRFRTNLRRVGNIFAYELSKVLDYSQKEIMTPLGIDRKSVRTHYRQQARCRHDPPCGSSSPPGNPGFLR